MILSLDMWIIDNDNEMIELRKSSIPRCTYLIFFLHTRILIIFIITIIQFLLLKA